MFYVLCFMFLVGVFSCDHYLFSLFIFLLFFLFAFSVFSYTFDSVQENTEQVWYSQRYFIIKEYHDRPPLAPPLIAISHFFMLVRTMFGICCRLTDKGDAFSMFTSICNMVIKYYLNFSDICGIYMTTID